MNHRLRHLFSDIRFRCRTKAADHLIENFKRFLCSFQGQSLGHQGLSRLMGQIGFGGVFTRTQFFLFLAQSSQGFPLLLNHRLVWNRSRCYRLRRYRSQCLLFEQRPPHLLPQRWFPGLPKVSKDCLVNLHCLLPTTQTLQNFPLVHHRLGHVLPYLDFGRAAEASDQLIVDRNCFFCIPQSDSSTHESAHRVCRPFRSCGVLNRIHRLVEEPAWIFCRTERTQGRPLAGRCPGHLLLKCCLQHPRIQHRSRHLLPHICLSRLAKAS